MRIHKEGYSILLGSGVFVAGLIVLVLILPLSLFWTSVLSAALAILWVFLLQFFRNPVRIIPHPGDHLFYAPADGQIVAIEEIEETEYFHDRRLQISIFMSPLNIHLNRVPLSGTVSYYRYHPGKHFVAWHPKASTDNEMATVGIRYAGGELLVRQIAGAMARRIRTYIKEGQSVQQGEELGFIRMGSRVDLILPIDVVVDVEIGQEVRSNLDVVARLTD